MYQIYQILCTVQEINPFIEHYVSKVKQIIDYKSLNSLNPANCMFQ